MKKNHFKIIIYFILVLFIMININCVSAEELQENKYKIVTKSYITGEVTTKVVYPNIERASRPIIPAYIPNNLESDSINDSKVDILATSGRHYVSPTKFPYKAIGQLEATFIDSKGNSITSLGSAALKGPDIAFSAAHCIYDESIGWADTVEFYPARDGYGNSPNYAIVDNISIADSYAKEGKDDWSILFLDRDLGDLGWFGLGIASSSLINKSLKTSGYDGDKNGQQWETIGVVKRVGDNYDEDNLIMDLTGLDEVAAGHSGGPIFDDNGVLWSNYTFGGGAYSGGGRAIDNWLYDVLQEEYYNSLKRYPRYN